MRKQYKAFNDKPNQANHKTPNLRANLEREKSQDVLVTNSLFQLRYEQCLFKFSLQLEK